jgi:hypothetical protein
MGPSGSRVTAKDAIFIAQRFLLDAKHPIKEIRKASLDFEGMWTVEIELPFEGRLAKLEIDSGTGEVTGFQLFDILEEG